MTIKNIIISFSISVCTLLIGCHAQNNLNSELLIAKGEIDTFLQNLHNNDQLNGNVSISKDNFIVLEKSYGVVDGQIKNRLNLNNRFNIGSIYKELPAVAIMQLHEKKLLSIDNTISKFYPDFPAWAQKISIKNLLQYTSGLPRIAWGKDPDITDQVLLQNLKNIEQLEFEPGSDYLYTNNSPFLLAKIVEQVTQKSFIDYAQENLLKPAGMLQSEFKKSFPYTDRNLMAIPFNSQGVEDSLPFTIRTPNLLFSTTVSDMQRWLTALHTNQLISNESLNFLGKTAEITGKDMQSALGNSEFENDVLTKHLHHGSSGNFESLIIADNVTGISIVLMTNSKKENLFEISEKIIRYLNY